MRVVVGGGFGGAHVPILSGISCIRDVSGKYLVSVIRCSDYIIASGASVCPTAAVPYQIWAIRASMTKTVIPTALIT